MTRWANGKTSIRTICPHFPVDLISCIINLFSIMCPVYIVQKLSIPIEDIVS